jgi:hypothetical protein
MAWNALRVMNAAQSKPSAALRLVAAAAALRNVIGSPLSLAEQARLDKYLKPAREALSLEDQALQGAVGAAMNFEEVIAAVRSR